MIGLRITGSRMQLGDNFDTDRRYPRQAVASPVEFWMVQTRSLSLITTDYAGGWRWECGPASVVGGASGVPTGFASSRGVATK